MRSRLLVMAPLLIVLSACGSGATDSTPDCGWDLRTDAGRQANGERLTFATQWLATNPGTPVPAPTSSFWHGECPTPSQVPGPPEGEGDHPDG